MDRNWHFDLILTLAEGAAILILAGLAGTVLWQLLVGKINLRGLLDDKLTGGFSPGRLQLLVFTLMGTGEYLIRIHDKLEKGDLTTLPGVPETLLLMLGGSNLFYLGGKSMPGLLRLIAAMISR